MRIFTSLSIFILLSSILSLPAAAEVKIHGKITNSDNEPVEFATVRIAGTTAATTSGLDGTYRISTAEADTVRITFTSVGYIEQTRTLYSPKGDLTINIRMMQNVKELQGVEVSEIKKQTGSMQNVASDSYRFAPDASGNGVESLITTMAGVSGANEMSSQYSVRGGSYDENSVRINGIEVFRPQLISSGQQEGLSIINPDMVGAVGFSTGGFPAEYADKMSSVLDITYRRPEPFEGSVSASLMGASVAIGQSSAKFSQLHGLRYHRNASLLSSMETRGEYDPNFLDYQTNIELALSRKVKMSFLGNIAVNNYKFTPQDRTTNFGTANDAKRFKVYFDGREKDRFETWFGAYTLDYAPVRDTRLSLTASGFISNELVTYDISGEYWLDQAGTGSAGDSESVGGELGVGRYMEHARNRLKSSVFTIDLKGATTIKRHTLSYGISWRHDNFMERSREWEMRDSAGFSLPNDPVNLRMIYSLKSHQDMESSRTSGFIQDRFTLQTEKGFWTFNAGLRASYCTFSKETLISPRVNVGFIPERNNHWAFRLASGIYYQAPFYKEYRMAVTDANNNQTIVLNPDLKSQRSIQVVAGADYTFRAFNRPFKLSGEVYYKALSDLIPYEIDNLKVVYTGRNESDGYVAGVDMKLFGQFVPGSDSWISLSLMNTRENLNGVKVPRPTDRRYNLALFFTDYFPKFPKLKFSLRGIFSDGLPMTAPRSSRDKGYFRTPAYKRIDIGLMYALLSPLKEGESRSGWLRHLKSVWLGADVFNLLDISNVSSYYWVTDVNSIQYAVPNYLTRRQINVRLSIDF